MSAIGGILSLSDWPINGKTLTLLGQALSVGGPDGGGDVLMNCIGMSYRAFHTNPESRLEKQPLVSPEGRMLVLDGRLDNREELLSLLRVEIRDDLTDVAIVMAAYNRWGADFLPRIIGDFALSLWDPTTRALLLARDAVGCRTLYYHNNENMIIWSSDLDSLLNLAEITVEVDDEYVAGYLTYDPEPCLTPYKSFHAVSPGNVLIVQRGQLRLQRFWGLEPSHQIRYKTDAEYEEHFRHLFRQGVRCRLRADGPVWSELSGGLDSSSIVSMADQIIASGESPTPRLETVSQVYDECPSSDERRFIRYIEEQRGRMSHNLREEDYRLFAFIGNGYQICALNPSLVSAEYHRGLRELMQADNARVLLSGLGGDQMLSSSQDPSPALADLLVEGNLLQLHRRVLLWSQVLKKPYVELLWERAVLATLPRRLQTICRRGLARKVAPWLDHKFVARMKLRERMLGPKDIFDCRLPSSRDQSIGFLSAVRSIAAGYRREISHVEVSYPYLHRPLVEFLQAIPFEQRVRPGETRSLMRRALRHVLPEKIARRRGKGDPTEVIFRAMAREWPLIRLLFVNARVCSHGYVESKALQRALGRDRQGCGTHSLALIKTITLEYWLRALERRYARVEESTAGAGAYVARPASVHIGPGPVAVL